MEIKVGVVVLEWLMGLGWRRKGVLVLRVGCRVCGSITMGGVVVVRGGWSH